MELWIRSQDRECLMKINRIDYDYSLGEHKILVNGYQTLVGKYTSKERALEVLDEIQHLIHPSMNFIVSQHIDFDNDSEGLIRCNILKEEPKAEKISDCIVYEMPKD